MHTYRSNLLNHPYTIYIVPNSQQSGEKIRLKRIIKKIIRVLATEANQINLSTLFSHFLSN